MVFASLFPLGILQLYHSVSKGYFDARSLGYLTERTNALIEWLRLPGDVLFIAGGILPILYLTWLAVRHMARHVAREQPAEILFTEVVEAGVKQS
jgi:nitric oxide reductase subunit B